MQYIVCYEGNRKIVDAETPYEACAQAAGHGGITQVMERTLKDGRIQRQLEVGVGHGKVLRVTVTTLSDWMQNLIPTSLNAGA